jgi:hypothetical protein
MINFVCPGLLLITAAEFKTEIKQALRIGIR